MNRREPITLPSHLSLSQMQQINERCNRFESAWRAGKRPRIEEYLADGPASLPALQQLILLDVDYRRQQGDDPAASDYLARFPALDADWLAAVLTESCLAEATEGGRGAASAGISPGVFLDRLAQRGLLPEDEIQALRRDIQTDPGTTTEALAGRLVGAGKLAEYQARALSAPVPVPLVLGPYVLDGWIASGGMGKVFRATHERMKRVVALKVVHGASARPELLRRFQHEVEVAARLHHPNIVTAFDAGEQDGVAYLVTAFVDGEDLGRLVRRRGPLPVGHAVDLIRQAALGLAHAHAQGVIHRDVKPSNLILGRDGIVRVLDVGLARTAKVTSECHSSTGPNRPAALTQVGAVMGTADYMPPEQAEDASSADARADVYSLGCTLHYLLTGRPPYEGTTVGDLLLAHLHVPVPSLRAARAEVPAPLDQLFRQMLAKSPADRPPGMDAVIDALDAAIRSPRRFNRRAILLGGAAALAGVAGVLAYFREDTPSPKPPEGPPKLPPLAPIPFDAAAEQRRWADALGIPVTKDVMGIPFVLVPPGSFTMGTPDDVIREWLAGAGGDDVRFLMSEAQREAVVAEPFYLSATEVTVGQFRRFIESSRPRHVTLAEREQGWGWDKKHGWQRARGYSWQDAGELILTDDHPVVNIAWDDADAYCRWMTAQAGSVCRLPTEVEWEFACRAGSAGLWCFGDDADPLPLHAWTTVDSRDLPQPVAGKRPNAFGLFDMHGNQFEWCRPTSGDWPDDEDRPVRGGNFRSPAGQTRSASRRWLHRFDVTPGFRVLQAIAPRP